MVIASVLSWRHAISTPESKKIHFNRSCNHRVVASVTDWTYEQLLQLRLKHNNKVTDYKICTLYEAVALSGGRCFINVDDKAAELNLNTDIFLLAKEFNAKKSFFYYYGLSKIQPWTNLDPGYTEFKDYIKRVSGYLSLSGHSMPRRNFTTVTTYGDNPTAWEQIVASGIRMLFTDNIYEMQKYLALNYTELKDYYNLRSSYLSLPGHKIRARKLTNNDASTNAPESEEIYAACYNEGKTLLYSNFIIQFQQYIAKTYSPDKPAG